MSYGYRGKRKRKHDFIVEKQQNELTAQYSLERATKLLAQDKTEKALEEYKAILTFHPKSQAAPMAQMYIDQIAKESGTE